MPTATRNFQPGMLVRYRGRRWVVMPPRYPEALLLKPLGGSDEEITGVLHDLHMPGEEVRQDNFPHPTPDERGDFYTARLLFDAARLSFRQASGPFRCMGKLGFRPRSYQVVPLVMALQLDPVRMLIADDVGIGKTIEALLILRELLERGEIRSFAVICPPHLCDQWQGELRDKLDIQATLIRTSTAAALDRSLPDDRCIFHHHPYQVISIDYIKAERRRDIFLTDCPDLVIVDEAHTCTRPPADSGKTSSQQQRFNLLRQIADKPDRHILLLTATPHSGKTSQFLSLLGLLDREFESIDLGKVSQAGRRRIAEHFIQRRRDHIKQWGRQDTRFPDRDSKEIQYTMTMAYLTFYNEALDFARGITEGGEGRRGQRMRYWAALGLMRGIMSSPAAGLEMLLNRHRRKAAEEALEEDLPNPILESDDDQSDTSTGELLDMADLNDRELKQLRALSQGMQSLFGPAQDGKLHAAILTLKSWLKEGFHPIVFCKYIATARYVGEQLRAHLPADVRIGILTSDNMTDEDRRAAVLELGRHPKRLMVATDCLSEGINLQEQFTAVLHYDLPWNPNRIEQREGRVDRFGQAAPVVKTWLLWSDQNPIDQIVLRVLINKVREIQRTTGLSIPIAEENQNIMDAVLEKVLINPTVQHKAVQASLDFGDEYISEADRRITRELDEARESALRIRDIFAHNNVREEDIVPQLQEIDEAIGDIADVEHFVVESLRHLGVQVHPDGSGYAFDPQALPPHLRLHWEGWKTARISFDSPTPPGYRYVGRNHRFTEQLCHFLLSLAFDVPGTHRRVGRCAVIRTEAVTVKTTLVLFRVRNVLREGRSRRELVAEEMYLWGYEGSDGQGPALSYEAARDLLVRAVPAGNLSDAFQREWLEMEDTPFRARQDQFMAMAEERARHLVEAHNRYRNLVGGKHYEAVHPVLPPDLMGMYVLLPPVKKL